MTFETSTCSLLLCFSSSPCGVYQPAGSSCCWWRLSHGYHYQHLREI